MRILIDEFTCIQKSNSRTTNGQYPIFLYNEEREEASALVFESPKQIFRLINYLESWLESISDIQTNPCDSCEAIRFPEPLTSLDEPPF